MWLIYALCVGKPQGSKISTKINLFKSLESISPNFSFGTYGPKFKKSRRILKISPPLKSSQLNKIPLKPSYFLFANKEKFSETCFTILKAYSQCGNLAIFLSLWFYLKSILAYFRGSKIAILTILEALNFEFWEFHGWKCQKYQKIQTSELL